VTTRPYGPYCTLEQLIGLKATAEAIAKNRVKPKLRLRDGFVRSRLAGRGMDFEEARPYQAGDDARHIEWRVTARSGKLHTKLFTEEKERSHIIVVDQRLPMFFGTKKQFKSTLAAEVAALLGWHSLTKKDQIGGLVVGNDEQIFHRPSSRTSSWLHLLREVAAENHLLNTELARGETSSETITTELSQLAKPGSHITFISDFSDFTQNASSDLLRLRRHCSIRLIRIGDDWERQLPKVGKLQLTQPNQALHLNTSNPLQSEQFEKLANELNETMVQLLQPIDPFLIDIKTGDDIRYWGQRIIHG